MRPGGLTLIPWKGGKYLTWDVTMADTFTATYVTATSVKTSEAAVNKREKYDETTRTHLFCPLAVETMGPVEEEGREFLSAIGH